MLRRAPCRAATMSSGAPSCCSWGRVKKAAGAAAGRPAPWPISAASRRVMACTSSPPHHPLVSEDELRLLGWIAAAHRSALIAGSMPGDPVLVEAVVSCAAFLDVQHLRLPPLAL